MRDGGFGGLGGTNIDPKNIMNPFKMGGGKCYGGMGGMGWVKS